MKYLFIISALLLANNYAHGTHKTKKDKHSIEKNKSFHKTAPAIKGPLREPATPEEIYTKGFKNCATCLILSPNSFDSNLEWMKAHINTHHYAQGGYAVADVTNGTIKCLRCDKKDIRKIIQSHLCPGISAYKDQLEKI